MVFNKPYMYFVECIKHVMILMIIIFPFLFQIQCMVVLRFRNL